jgi:hypothetical protein
MTPLTGPHPAPSTPPIEEDRGHLPVASGSRRQDGLLPTPHLLRIVGRAVLPPPPGGCSGLDSDFSGRFTRRRPCLAGCDRAGRVTSRRPIRWLGSGGPPRVRGTGTPAERSIDIKHDIRAPIFITFRLPVPGTAPFRCCATTHPPHPTLCFRCYVPTTDGYPLTNRLHTPTRNECSECALVRRSNSGVSGPERRLVQKALGPLPGGLVTPTATTSKALGRPCLDA